MRLPRFLHTSHATLHSTGRSHLQITLGRLELHTLVPLVDQRQYCIAAQSAVRLAGFSAAGQAATSRVLARRDLHSAPPLLLVQNWPRFGTLARQKFPARKCISATIVTWSRRNNPKSNQLLAKRDARRGREQGSSAIEGLDWWVEGLQWKSRPA